MLRIHSKPTELTKNWSEIEKNFQCAMWTKGQLISKCSFAVTKLTKTPPSFIKDFCPRL